MSSTAGVRVVQVFTLNDLNDPNQTGVGAQPEGYDEWCTLYDRWRVVKSHIKITMASFGTTPATNSFRVVLVPLSTATPESSMADAASSVYAQQRFTSGATNPVLVMEKTMTMATLKGVSPQAVLDEINYSGATGAGPALGAWWHIYIEPSDATSTASIACFAEITYITDFYEREPLAISAEEQIKAQKGRTIFPDKALLEAYWRSQAHAGSSAMSLPSTMQ